MRQLARSYPCDSFDDDAEHISTLIGDTDEVNQNLLIELQERADDAGVEIIESRITDLSQHWRSPRRCCGVSRHQRSWQPGQRGAITLDNDRRATFASNLMTVIASDTPTAPVVNVGTLNH